MWLFVNWEKLYTKTVCLFKLTVSSQMFILTRSISTIHDSIYLSIYSLIPLPLIQYWGIVYYLYRRLSYALIWISLQQLWRNVRTNRRLFQGGPDPKLPFLWGTRTPAGKSPWSLLSGLPPRDQSPHPTAAAVHPASLPELVKPWPAVRRFL